VALIIGAPAGLLQPISGDISARTVATWQPIKLTALEGQFETETGAPLKIGGVPDPTAAENLERPCGRGLMLMRHYMNEVVYSSSGNTVSMSKLLRAAATFVDRRFGASSFGTRSENIRSATE